MIWGNREAEYFCAEDSTEIMRDLPVGQHKGLGVEGRELKGFSFVIPGRAKREPGISNFPDAQLRI